MSLDLSNSNKLDDDFSNYIMVGVGTIQRKKRPYSKNIIPTALPSGDRLEDEFGGSARYPRFSEMNTFNDGIPAKIESVADTDYEYTPYGYTTDRVYEKPREEYSNFRLFGIGEESEKQKERREKRKEKKEERKDKRKSAKDERRKMPFGKRFVNIANKYNPAVAVPRTSALTSIRLNLFGIATRLYPALLSESELKKRNLDVSNAKRAKESLEKINKKWLLLGGSTAGLEKAIRNGYKKPIFKTKKAKARVEEESKLSSVYGYSNATGVEEGVVGTYILAGLPVVASLLGIIKQNQANKNPYVEGSKEGQDFGKDLSMSETDITLTPEQEAEIKRLQDLAKEDLDKGLGYDESTGELEGDKILGMPPAVFYIGLGVVALVGGYFIYKKIIVKK